MDSSSFFDSSIFSLSSEQWMALYPFLILFFGCALNTLLAAFRVSDKILKLSLLAVFGAAGFIFVRDWSQPSQFFLGNSLEIESSLRILAAIILLSAILCVLFIEGDTEERHSEWALLVNTSVLGMILLLGARNWIAFFVYLETLSIPGYILAALHTRKLHSIEAGLKYLMMGAFASSFLLLGITLIYGLAGSLDFETLQGVLMDLSSQEKLLVSVSTVILLSSFAFKVALIPFHMWAPDVYQGAPTGVAAFLGSTTKVALFGAILISFERSGFFGFLLTKQFFVLFGALSIVMGSLLAISQKSIKRMLAYSGIVHVGYVALVSARGESSLGAVAYYLAVYSITFIGALWCVHQLEKQNGAEKKDILITELTALSLKAKLPTLISLAFFLFSLAGIPPLPGFFVKYLLLKELFTHGNLFSFTLILVGTFFGLAYYLRCLIPLFFHDKIWERGALLQSQTTKCNGLSWVGVIIAVMTFGLLAFASFFDSWGSFVAATTAR